MATFKDDQCARLVGNESHLSRLSPGLNQLRQQATFCDVNINVGDQRFPAHKAVLSSTSVYFHGMFTSGFQESIMSEVTVPGTEEGFAQILDFAYTGYFTLSLRTVIDILKMSCYMVFTEAMESCAEYMREVKKDKFTIEDCFEIWCITSSHSCLSDIAQSYRSHLMKNFSKCVDSQAFLEKSSASVMMEFLSDDEIESDNMMEEQILQAALMWLKFDWEQRRVHAIDILKKIRLGLVPLGRLKEILGDELLAIPECKDMVEKVVKLSVTKDTASPPLIESHPGLFASRNTIKARLVMTKKDNNLESGSEPIISFKCTTNTACYKFTNLANIPNQYPYSGKREDSVDACVSKENQLYVAINIGYYNGKDNEDHYKWISENDFFQYIQEKNEWSVLPPMPEAMQFSKMFHLEEFQEYIYMIGESDYNSISSIQRFSILSKSWETLVDDILFSIFDSILLPTGQILLKGNKDDPSLDDDDYGVLPVVALYKPANNELLDVAVDGTLADDSPLLIHDSKVFERIRCWGAVEEVYKIVKLICNFDSDKPTVVLAEATEDEARAVIDTDYYPEFTFDKRKLGLVPVPCECESHVQKE